MLTGIWNKASTYFHTFCRAFCTPNFCVETKESSKTRIAMSTSSCVTCCRRCILACASDIRIIDSMCLTAIGTPCPCYKGLKARERLTQRDSASNSLSINGNPQEQTIKRRNLRRTLFSIQHKHEWVYPYRHHATSGTHSTSHKWCIS